MTDALMPEAVSPVERRSKPVGYYDYSAMRPGRVVAAAGYMEPPQGVKYVNGGITQRPRGEQVVLSIIPIGSIMTETVEAPEVEVEQMESTLRRMLTTLLDEWLEASRHQSSMRQAGKHINFQLLRKVGPLTTELVAKRLMSEPNPLWIWTLRELTGEDPAREAETVSDATAAWQRWVHEHGLD